MYLYSLWVRLWHLLNAVMILILIFTGISIFFPEKESSFFIMDLSRAKSWHDVTSKILIGSYILFLAGNLVSENGKHYRITEKKFISALWKQFRYYIYGRFKNEKNPFRASFENKFNPLQKLSYLVIMYAALPLVIFSGIGMMYPEAVTEKLFGPDGYYVLDIMHIVMSVLITLFLVIHIYLGVVASKPTAGLRGIITGYSESED